LTGGSELQGSQILLAVATVLVGAVWLMFVTDDPTGGFAIFSLGYAAATIIGIGLVIASSRRRDLFGNLGLAGAIVVLVSALGGGIPLALIAVPLGSVLMAVAVGLREPLFLVGLGSLALGVVGMTIRVNTSEDGYVIFLPLIAVGAGVLALALGRLSSHA
jgi:hypothetical protein